MLPRYAKDFWSFRTEVSRFDAIVQDSADAAEAVNKVLAEIADTQRLLAQARGNPLSLQANLHFRLGELNYRISYLEPALEAFSHAKDLYLQIDNRQNYASTLGNIGLIHQARGDLEAALRAHEEALRIDREIGYSCFTKFRLPF